MVLLIWLNKLCRGIDNYVRKWVVGVWDCWSWKIMVNVDVAEVGKHRRRERIESEWLVVVDWW